MKHRSFVCTALVLLVVWLLSVWAFVVSHSSGDKMEATERSGPPSKAAMLVEDLEKALDSAPKGHHLPRGIERPPDTTTTSVAPLTLAQSTDELSELHERLAAAERALKACRQKKPTAAAVARSKRPTAAIAASPTPQPPPPTPPRQAEVHRSTSTDTTAKWRSQRGTIKGLGAPSFTDDTSAVVPVVVFTYNRPKTLQRCVETLLQHMPKERFRLFISQDGADSTEVTAYIDSLTAQHEPSVVHLVHQRDDSGATDEERQNNGGNWDAYYAIAHHYGWAIGTILSWNKVYSHIIVIEEDIEVAADFFALMSATMPLFAQDPTLYCVSGWNDNGKVTRIRDQTALYRTDNFPGLGWMTSRAIWAELEPKWPAGFWDDWMRQPVNRRGRSCLRPEVPRTFTWCDAEGGGVSQGLFCHEHMEAMRLAEAPVDWAAHNMSRYLKPTYDAMVARWLREAREMPTVGSLEELPPNTDGEYRITYASNDDFISLAHALDIMDDFKDGVPRTAYRGVVSVRHNGNRVHLASAAPLYDYQTDSSHGRK